MANMKKAEDVAKAYLSKQLSENRFSSGLIKQNQKLKAHNKALIQAIRKRLTG